MKSVYCTILLASITAVTSAQAPVKKVLIEEFTTSLCGFCPPKSYEINQFYEANTATSVFMTQHAGFGTDSLTNAAASTFASYFQPSTFGFAPAVMVDRALYPAVDSVPYMSVDGFDTLVQSAALQTAEVSLAFSGTYDPATRVLNFDVTCEFFGSPASLNRNLHLFVVEDSVIGSGYKWDQKCYDASWANTHYPGQYNATSSEILQYPHRHAQRVALTGTWGNSSLIPMTPALQTPYTLNTVYTIPANFNADKVRIVAFVAVNGTNKFNKQVLNVEEAWVSSFPITTGISEAANTAAFHAVYPNPATAEVTVDVSVPTSGQASLKLYDLSGKLIHVAEPEQHISAGRYLTRFDVNTVPAGTYFLKLQGAAFTQVSKLVIVH